MAGGGGEEQGAGTECRDEGRIGGQDIRRKMKYQQTMEANTTTQKQKKTEG